MSIDTRVASKAKINWGPIGEEIYRRTYSRIKADGTNETWPETVQRVVSGNTAHGTVKLYEAERLAELILPGKALPAGRHLWITGTGLPFTRNCFRAPWSSRLADHFEFMADQLLTGGGVGANYSSEYIEQSPKLKQFELFVTCSPSHPEYSLVKTAAGPYWIEDWVAPDQDINMYRVPDMREGWAFGWGSLFDAATSPKRYVALNVSDLRPSGAPINTFGGTASGPEPFVRSIVDVFEVLWSSQGRHLTATEAMLCDHHIASAVVAGGARRSARMSVVHWNDKDIFNFINCKTDHMHHWTTNISVEVDDAFFAALSENDHHAKKVFKQTVAGMWNNGEPGFMNTTKASEGERADVRSSNPCVTGDTLVAVADGRGAVSLKELADADQDVPVYTWDGVKVVVRMMRAPRRTGENVPVVVVTLDNGEAIRVTPNHKFVLRDGSIVEAANLVNGMSLRIMSRYQSSFVPGGFRKNRQPYWNISAGRASTTGEHRLIAGFHTNQDRLPSYVVVHHKNRVGVDNRPSNLELMTKEDHDQHHGSLMCGELNPMVRGKNGEFGENWKIAYHDRMSNAVTGELNGRFSGVSNESLRDIVLEETRQAGRRLSTTEWLSIASERGIPQHFSGWRKAQLNGGVRGILVWASIELGFEGGNIDPRTLKNFKNKLASGYDCRLNNNEIVYRKSCEICDVQFETRRRETGICSTKCNIQRLAAIDDILRKRMASIDNTWKGKHVVIRDHQAETFSSLRSTLGRNPTKSEWMDRCKKNNISAEVGRISSPFTAYKELVHAGENYNHKVVSVVSGGSADVYTGTVDEFHTFFSGAWETSTSSGKPKQSFILNVQCGEIFLEEGESCNIGSVDLAQFGTDDEGAEEAFRLMARFLIRATLIRPYQALTAEVEHRNRRIGVGFLGLQGWAAAYGVKYSDVPSSVPLTTLLNLFRTAIRDEADSYCDELGIARCIKVTAIAPNGTISQLFGTQAGGHAILARHAWRNVRYTMGDARIGEAVTRGLFVEPDIYASNTMVVRYPLRDVILDRFPDHMIQQTSDVSLNDQLAVLSWITDNFCGGTDGNAVSFTANLDRNAFNSVDDVERVIGTWLPNLKGLTVFPALSRPQSPYVIITKAEYEEAAGSFDFTGQAEVECSATGSCPIR